MWFFLFLFFISLAEQVLCLFYPQQKENNDTACS